MTNLLSFYLTRVLLMISSARHAPRSVNWWLSPSVHPIWLATHGGHIVTKQVVVNPPLNLKGKIYKICLIILDGQEIDAILGMSWMRRHRALLDTAARVVHLDSPEHDSVTLQLTSTPVPDTSAHHTVAQNLKDIPIVNPKSWFSEWFHRAV
jgi:hypothetical protein